MSNDNKPTLRVVTGSEDERKKELIGFLRTAIELVEKEDCVGVMISVVKENGDLVSLTSSSEKRHVLVSAALYQLLDVAGVNEGKHG